MISYQVFVFCKVIKNPLNVRKKIVYFASALALYLIVLFGLITFQSFTDLGRESHYSGAVVSIYILAGVFGFLLLYNKFFIADLVKPEAPKVEGQNFEYYVPPMPTWETNPFKSHGSADWDNPKDFRDRPDSRSKVKVKTGGSIYIGGGLSRNYLHSLTHVVTVAGSGQGKGACVILPNLLSKPNSSWFVLDPKGENAKITARYQKENGQKVVILDPWNEQERLGATHKIPRMGFNPLDFVKGNPEEMVESCGVIASMLVPDRRGDDPFWNNRARALIKTYLMFLIAGYHNTKEHHLGTLYKWLRLPFETRQRLWEDMANCDALHGIVKTSINEFASFGKDSKTMESIFATALDCTTFLESLPLQQSLERNHFNPYELTSGKMTVYLCLPERFLMTHNRWLRLVVGVCLKACNYRPNNRVHFLLDEFAILGKMQDVENAFAFARGQNIGMWIFVQSLTQLNDIYGEQAAAAFLANARLRQFFGILDAPTQKYVSDYLGDTTIKVKTKNKTESSGQSNSSSTGKNEGKSSGGSTGGEGSVNWGNSSGTNESYSSGWTNSSSNTESEQYITRKLLTPEEVGKTKEIITLLDSQKFKINRVPYWKDATDIPLNERPYMPNNQSDWQNFWHEVCKNKGKDIAINFSEMGRPDKR